MSVWLAQVFKSLAAPVRVRSCVTVQENRGSIPGTDRPTKPSILSRSVNWSQFLMGVVFLAQRDFKWSVCHYRKLLLLVMSAVITSKK